MPRALLLLPTATYRAAGFLAAARRLGVEVVVASEEPAALASTMGDRAVVVPLDDPDRAAQVIEGLDARTPLDAVIAVDDPGVVVAARAGEQLGFPHNPPAAVARTRDKAALRAALAAAEVPQPRYGVITDPEELPDVGWPRVVKPVGRSGSRDGVLARVERVTADAAQALGLTEGPIHAELRVLDDRAWVLEVAARSIGGLCARTLRLGAGISLEEVILRHALALPLRDLTRETQASGVMMLPISRSGTLVEVRGQDAARAVPGVVGLEVTIPRGRPIRALPDGDRYLGFLFARAPTPAEVEAALRGAHQLLDVDIA